MLDNRGYESYSIWGLLQLLPKKIDIERQHEEMLSAMGIFGGGEQAWVLRKLPMKMALFDATIVILALEDPVPKQTLTTQLAEHCPLAKGLRVLFGHSGSRLKTTIF